MEGQPDTISSLQYPFIYGNVFIILCLPCSGGPVEPNISSMVRAKFETPTAGQIQASWSRIGPSISVTHQATPAANRH